MEIGRRVATVDSDPGKHTSLIVTWQILLEMTALVVTILPLKSVESTAYRRWASAGGGVLANWISSCRLAAWEASTARAC